MSFTSPQYGLHAERYRRYRPGYPDWLFDQAVEACGAPLDYAVDLGAGSGQATPQLLKRFARVTAVEPDPEMAALIPRDPRLTVQVAPAEAAVFDGPLDAAFAATSFHWMDAARVSRLIADALRPGGVFLAFAYGPFEVVSPDAARAAFEAEMAIWSPRFDPRLSDWRPYPEMLRDTGVFASVRELQFIQDEDRTAEAAAGLFLTASYAAAHARATGDETAYMADFAARLEAAADGAPIVIRYTFTGGLARP